MSKKGRRKQPPRRGHLRSLPTTSEPTTGDPVQDQPLIRDLRAALRADHPLVLLALISSMLHVLDPRRVLAQDEDEPTDMEGVIDSFVGTDLAETTAALHVFAALVPDDLVRARIRKVLPARRQPMRVWLRELDRAEVTRVELMTDTLGDGDNYLIEVRLAGGELMSPIVYVDHNLGTVVKDAFVIPEGLDRVVDRYEQLMDESQSIDPLDPAAARAQLTRAIADGDDISPPLQSEEWPQCRPLVEWVVGLMPTGGSVAARPVWTSAEGRGAIDSFFNTSAGRGLDGRASRHVVDLLWQFGLEVGPGDPLRWSPVNVEMVLTGWLPDALAGSGVDPDEVITVLRAWIVWCHQRQQLLDSQTAETLASVDTWDPAFRVIAKSSDELAESEARLAALEGGGPLDDAVIAEIMVEAVDEATGSRAETVALSADPLPDESFDWSHIPDDVHDRVVEVLAVVDRCCDELLDTEHRTAARRFLACAAASDPKIFRRRSSPERAAAAVCWAVCRANDSVGPHASFTTQELLEWFGVKGSISQRAEVFLTAVGVDPYRRHGSALGNVDYLVGTFRRELIEKRDRWLPHL